MKRRSIAAAAVLAAASGGCIHRPACPVAGPYDSAAVETLECAAAGDDKVAALELGRRYEEGRGVPRDLRRAKRYYARAAATAPSQMYVYSPPVGDERYGRVISVDAPGIPTQGLPEARERLDRLRAAEKGATNAPAGGLGPDEQAD